MTQSLTRTGRIAMVVVAMLIAGLLAPVWAQGQSTIAIGPYVQNVGKDNATICWATLSGQVTATPAGGEPQTVPEYEHHSILLRNLQPGTTYAYDVPVGGADGGKGAFTTVPEAEQPFHFLVYGDTRPTDAHRRLIPMIIAEQPAMVLHTGDLMSDGRRIRDWETFFEVAGSLMRNIPLYPVLGNHESDSPLYHQFFALPGNERYYSFDRGPVHFVVLDSSGLRIPETNQALTKDGQARFNEMQAEYWRRQMQWLREDLAGHQDAKYIFVFFHHPLYSVNAKRAPGTNESRKRWGTIFQDYNVTAVFNGHDHHYHRVAAGGVTFITTGGGGAGLYDTDAPQPETVKYAKVYNYVRVDVGPEQAKVRATDIDGNTIDEFELLARQVPAAVAK